MWEKALDSLKVHRYIDAYYGQMKKGLMFTSLAACNQHSSIPNLASSRLSSACVRPFAVEGYYCIRGTIVAR